MKVDNLIIAKKKFKSRLIVGTGKYKTMSECAKAIKLSGADIELYSMDDREWALGNAFKSSNLDNYQYILIDCPPSLSLLTINAFAGSDSLLIPVQCEFYAMEGLAQLQNCLLYTSDAADE